MTTKYPETKKRMIKEIIKHSEFYHSQNELEKMKFHTLKSVYYACMIPLREIFK